MRSSILVDMFQHKDCHKDRNNSANLPSKWVDSAAAHCVWPMKDWCSRVVKVLPLTLNKCLWPCLYVAQETASWLPPYCPSEQTAKMGCAKLILASSGHYLTSSILCPEAIMAECFQGKQKLGQLHHHHKALLNLENMINSLYPSCGWLTIFTPKSSIIHMHRKRQMNCLL